MAYTVIYQILYVACSIALIQLTKRYSGTRAIVLKTRERILRRICFEIRRNNSNFYVSTSCWPFEGGPQGKHLQYFPSQYGPAGILRLLFAVK